MSDGPALLEREEPRARLEAALEAARRGKGRVVTIEGEAGIGKTSLVLSFADVHRSDARVHVGGCEHLSTPEPLGPLRDIARESQGRFALAASGQLASFESLLRLLTNGRGPALLVIEDLHWADDPTLDAMRYLGRRIRDAPILVAVTFRNDEPASQDRLASLWADMPRDARERVELRPLSLQAVSTLAHSGGRAARDVFEATGGNPFHVTEYLAAEEPGVPRSVQDATVARAARLSRRARRVLDCAAISPRQIREESLRTLAEDKDDAGLEECLRSGMLNARGGALAFRHELARRAIHDAMAPLRRRELHAAALVLLKGRNDASAVEIAHHAEQAGAVEDLVTYSARAAEEASDLGALREAVAHLDKALAHGTWLSNRERADLLERQAEAGELCGAFDIATRAIEEAISVYRRAGDVLGLGNALRLSARLSWLEGQPVRAGQRIHEAVEVLRARDDTWQYALALSGQAQLDSLADRNDLAISRGREAMARAERLGRWDVYLHAMTNVAMTRSQIDLDAGLAQTTAAIAEARARDEPDFLPRLYVNLTYVMTVARRYTGLFEAFGDGLKAALERDNAPLEAYMRGSRAAALLDLGRAEEAIAEAEYVLHGPYPHGLARFPALIAFSRARVRLGLRDGGALEEARALPIASQENMRLAPIAIADAEACWLGLSRLDARARLRDVLDRVVQAQSQPWLAAEAALWLTVLGDPPELPDEVLVGFSEAHRQHVAGRWREAAAAWARVGAPYEQAVALSAGDEAAQRQALGLFDRLGAAPAARRLRQAMRQAGVRGVPSGPRTARRNDPAGLTPRQNQVLALLADGLSNGDIAERLATSPKTVEHHVSAILAAFEAPSRARAVQIARERGHLDSLQG
ncbi:AAA family ATPase [Phenylobacterium sp. LjRoot225]|uniref:ATP-binding protein n=1 Tax=Phenylobacterium sp. LjRoot225 TaxID=3342285 RepID=UPI003ECD9A58